MKETVKSSKTSEKKDSTITIQPTSYQVQKQLEEFLDYYNKLEDKHKRAIFNLVKTLYMDSV